MTIASRLPALPDGFVLEAGARGVLACRPDDVEALAAAGFSPDGLRRGADGNELQDAEESGKEPLGRLEVGGRACLARRFRHGGLARVLTGRRFRDPARPFQELVLSERLAALGVPTPRVVAARAVSVRPYGFELTLVTERVPGTVDVGRLLGDVRRGSAGRARLRRALAFSGRLVRALHDAGFVHADLQPANVLVAEDEGDDRAWILDLDRSRFEGDGPLEPAARARNLGRLWRHVRRRERDYGAVLTGADHARFLRAYGARGSALRDLAAAIDRAADARGGLHRVGWWLERRFGHGHDARARGRE
ncbi:MAG: lipopolysaccharide kinase InaA family protein [Planctomycetota bacterium]